jgi:uncharacterized protein (UPF0254 family)
MHTYKNSSNVGVFQIVLVFDQRVGAREVHVRTCVHTYIHAHTHTYIHTYILTYTRAYKRQRVLMQIPQTLKIFKSYFISTFIGIRRYF